nr:MAG TPA: hypothetical protein [Caudoviricetes sp.]
MCYIRYIFVTYFVTYIKLVFSIMLPMLPIF